MIDMVGTLLIIAIKGMRIFRTATDRHAATLNVTAMIKLITNEYTARQKELKNAFQNSA